MLNILLDVSHFLFFVPPTATQKTKNARHKQVHDMVN